MYPDWWVKLNLFLNWVFFKKRTKTGNLKKDMPESSVIIVNPFKHNPYSEFQKYDFSNNVKEFCLFFIAFAVAMYLLGF